MSRADSSANSPWRMGQAAATTHGVDHAEAGIVVGLIEDATDFGGVIGLGAQAEFAIAVPITAGKACATFTIDGKGIDLLGFFGDGRGGRYIDQQFLDRAIGLTEDLQRGQRTFPTLDAAGAGVDHDASRSGQGQTELVIALFWIIDDQHAMLTQPRHEDFMLDKSLN